MSLVGYASDRLVGDGSVVRLAGRWRRSNLRGRHRQLVGILARRRHQHLVLFCNNKHQHIVPLCNNNHQHIVPFCNNKHNVLFGNTMTGNNILKCFAATNKNAIVLFCKTITKTNIICSFAATTTTINMFILRSSATRLTYLQTVTHLVLYNTFLR